MPGVLTTLATTSKSPPLPTSATNSLRAFFCWLASEAEFEEKEVLIGIAGAATGGATKTAGEDSGAGAASLTTVREFQRPAVGSNPVALYLTEATAPAARLLKAPDPTVGAAVDSNLIVESVIDEPKAFAPMLVTAWGMVIEVRFGLL